MLEGRGVSLIAVVAVFLSNLPEGLSSAAGMKKAGRSATYVFGVWGGLAILSGLAAMLVYACLGVFQRVSLGGRLPLPRAPSSLCSWTR